MGYRKEWGSSISQGNKIVTTQNQPTSQGIKLTANPTSIGRTQVHLVAYAGYSFALDGGAISTITPVNTCVIPANAVITSVAWNATTVPVGSGASISFGISAGVASGPTTCLVNTTAISGITLDEVTKVAVTSFKTTAQGNITFTVTGAALTAGVVEIWVDYYESAAS
jgi:hypothetical protein